MENLVVKISGNRYDFTGREPLFFGKEADIYELNSDKVVKCYYPVKDDYVRKRKVLALCDKYVMFSRDRDFATSVAMPQQPAFDIQDDSVLGFSMDFFKGGHRIFELNYDPAKMEYRSPDGKSHLTDETAVQLIFRLFELLEKIHRARIIIGDISPGNILYSFTIRQPCFVDIDSVKFEQFEVSTLGTSDYVDPNIERLGKTQSGHLKFNAESDIYGLTCIAYELCFGVHPFFLRCIPPSSNQRNARECISIIRIHKEGTQFLSSLGIKSYDGELLNKFQQRVRSILQRSNGGELLNKFQQRLRSILQVPNGQALVRHFEEVFIHGKRSSLLAQLPEHDARNPANWFVFVSGAGEIIDKILKAKEALYQSVPQIAPLRSRMVDFKEPDPDVFQSYLGMLNIQTSKLLA